MVGASGANGESGPKGSGSAATLAGSATLICGTTDEPRRIELEEMRFGSVLPVATAHEEADRVDLVSMRGGGGCCGSAGGGGGGGGGGGRDCGTGTDDQSSLWGGGGGGGAPPPMRDAGTSTVDQRSSRGGGGGGGGMPKLEDWRESRWAGGGGGGGGTPKLDDSRESRCGLLWKEELLCRKAGGGGGGGGFCDLLAGWTISILTGRTRTVPPVLSATVYRCANGSNPAMLPVWPLRAVAFLRPPIMTGRSSSSSNGTLPWNVLANIEIFFVRACRWRGRRGLRDQEGEIESRR